MHMNGVLELRPPVVSIFSHKAFGFQPAVDCTPMDWQPEFSDDLFGHLASFVPIPFDVLRLLGSELVAVDI